MIHPTGEQCIATTKLNLSLDTNQLEEGLLLIEERQSKREILSMIPGLGEGKDGCLTRTEGRLQTQY